MSWLKKTYEKVLKKPTKWIEIKLPKLHIPKIRGFRSGKEEEE